jgi:LPXTG-site transpeptidase (sortase) family protein
MTAMNLKKFFLQIKRKVVEHIKKHYQAYRWGSIGVSILGLALIIYPFVPEIINRLFPPDATESPYRIEDPDLVGIDNVKEDRIPEENRVVIPKIGVDSEIIEGWDISILNQHEGVWRDPGTKTPPDGGNMVLSGHRFQYLPPNLVTLYNLDKVDVDDSIIVYWEGKEYDYKVTETMVVEPTDVWIRNDTPGETRLTIYTCTPLWSNSHRLVVIADLISATV